MSDLSVVKNDIVADLNAAAKFFESFTSPSTQAQAGQAAQQLRQAAATAEGLLPSLADDAVVAVLNLIPGAAAFDPFAIQVVNLVIAKLQAATTPPAAAAPANQAS